MLNSTQDTIKSVAKALGILTTLAGLVTQFVLSDEVIKIINFNSESGRNMFSAYSFGGIILGIAIIIIIYKYRFELAKKNYWNKEAGRNYLLQVRELELKKNLEILDQQKKQQEIELEIIEPNYYTLHHIAILSFVIAIISFVLVFIVTTDITKALLYLNFILTFIFTLSVFMFEWFNKEEQLKNELRVKEFMLRKIEEYFLPKIQYSGQIIPISSTSPNRMIDFEVNGIQYRAFVNSENPEQYFEILNKKNI